MELSVTKIKAFKSCRRLYELKYIEGLRPVQKAEALEIGSNYHKLLEKLNKGEDIVWEFTKEMAMARAYQNIIYPKFKVVEVEKPLSYDLGDGNKLVGIADGIAADGHIVEHKTYGGTDSMEQYEFNLQWDEQILAYMLMTGMRKVWYTVCRKPTIRQKKDETDEQFFYRMLDWYEENPTERMRLFEIERMDAEVEEYRQNLLCMSAEISGAQNFYKNTCNCNMYGRRCEYSSVCLHYDPNAQYVEFTKENTEVLPEFAERGLF